MSTKTKWRSSGHRAAGSVSTPLGRAASRALLAVVGSAIALAISAMITEVFMRGESGSAVLPLLPAIPLAGVVRFASIPRQA